MGAVTGFHFTVVTMPLWSELASGGIVQHLNSWDGEDNSTRSIMDDTPL